MYGTHMVAQMALDQGRFACIKANKRLYIQDTVSGELLYTSPDFIQHRDRRLMMALAKCANERGAFSFTDVILLEALSPRGNGARKRPTKPETGHDAISTRFFFEEL